MRIRAGSLEVDHDGAGLCSIMASDGAAECSIMASDGAAECSIMASDGAAADGATLDGAAPGAVHALTAPTAISVMARIPARPVVGRCAIAGSCTGSGGRRAESQSGVT
ncbi:MAG: hypothetical protein NVS9B8_05090 [Candidatus Limnocylindrales bacterium]